ncbi:MAG: 3'-5' exonuclease [Candidatus Acidiferrales bacterium]
MPPRPYKNLVPDSPLYRDLEAFLRENGGQATVSEICEQVLRLPAVDTALAATLVSGLVEDDFRLRFNGRGTVEWVEPSMQEVWQACRRFVAVDVETTNGPLHDQRVIELGVCVVEDGRVTGEWTSLVNPQRPIPYWVRQITGINDETVRHAPLMEELLPRLLEDVQEAVLVGHHARFDVTCLNVELSRLWGVRMSNHYLCTVEVARRHLPGSENYRLETLSRWLRLTHTQPHRAGSDARATAELFCHLLGREGIPWSDFLRPRAVRPPAEKMAETKPRALA